MRYGILPGLLVVLVVGCGDPSTNPSQTVSNGHEPTAASGTTPDMESPDRSTQTSLPGPMFDQALELWQKGDQDHAVAVFLAIDDWRGPDLTSDGSLFAISEESFMSASRSRQTELTEQLIKGNETIRAIVRRVIAAAKEEPDAGKAKRMLKQIEACGKWLEDPGRTKQVQLLGKGVRMMAAQQIDQLSED